LPTEWATPSYTTLDGNWTIADGLLNDTAPSEFVRQVPVPGLVTLATPKFGHVGEAC